jgi:uncharacterized membrane protein
MEAYSNELTRPLGLLEITFSTLWFIGAMAYIKATGKRASSKDKAPGKE